MTTEGIDALLVDFFAVALDRSQTDAAALEVRRVEIAEGLGSCGEGLEDVAFPMQAVAARYVDEPGGWDALLRTAWLYLGRKPAMVVPGLHHRLAVALWRGGTRSAHLHFLSGKLGWFSLQTFVEALDHLELDDGELVALLTKVWADTSQDLAAGDVRVPLRAWVGGRRRQVEGVCERWLGASSASRPFPGAVFQLLVEAVVERNADAIGWRDAIIARLLSSVEVGDWETALHLGYLAWPAEERENIAQRTGVLLHHLARVPALLFEAGMVALARDARRFPVECLTVAETLMAEYGGLLRDGSAMDANRQRGARQSLAWLCQNALWAAERWEDASVVVEAVRRLLPALVAVERELVPQVLDGVVDGLARYGIDALDGFFAAWLVTHEPRLRGADLREIFQLFISERFPSDGGLAWGLRFVVHPDAAVRRVASGMLVHMERQLDDATIARLSDAQALGLVVQLRGMNVHGQVWIPIAVQVARLKPEVRGEVVELLVKHGAREFPGTLRDHARVGLLGSTGDGGASEELLASAAAMEAAVEAELEARRALRALPEASWTVPCAVRWISVFQQGWARMFREGWQQRSFVAALMPSIPVARGAALALSDEPSQRIELKTHESGPMEVNSGLSRDPLQYMLDSNAFLRRAAELLATSTEPV